MIDEVYRIVPNPKDIENPDAQMCIQILKGPFANSIIQYGRFKVKDVENAEDPNEVMAEFEYDIVGIPEEIKGVEFTDEQGEEFEHELRLRRRRLGKRGETIANEVRGERVGEASSERGRQQ